MKVQCPCCGHGFIPDADSKKYISLEDVLQSVLLFSKKTLHQISGGCREQSTVLARHTFFHLARLYTSASLKAIGRTVKKDHTTVINGLNKIKNRIATGDRDTVFISGCEQYLLRRIRDIELLDSIVLDMKKPIRDLKTA